MKQILKKRQEKLLTELPSRSLVLIFSAELKQRNNDCYYEFRQNSDFFYLTNFDEPNSALILIKENLDNKINRSIFFSQKKELKKEIWEGKITGYQKAKELYGFDQSYDFEDLLKIFKENLAEINCCYFDFLEQDYFFLKQAIKQTLIEHRITQVFNIKSALGKLRLIKSQEEIKNLKQSAQVNIRAHLAAISLSKPGIHEYNLQAVLEKTYREHNQKIAYNSIVASGKNATVLHYTDNDRLLENQELVLIDAGCEKDYYASDITRTFPVGKRFTSKQKDIYQIVLDTQKSIITEISQQKIKFFSEIHKRTLDLLLDRLIQINLIRTSKEQAYFEKLYFKFYMHGTSHWMGLDVHDPCPYKDEKNQSLELKPGMVFTIEPGLYFHESLQKLENLGKEKLNIKLIQEYLGIGIRIEDNILITKDGCEILTGNLPKEIKDLESLKI